MGLWGFPMPDDSDASVTHLLREKVRLEEELARHQQSIAVLFIDIVGSTSFYDQFGNVAGLTLVQKFLDRLVPIIIEHHGTPIKTIGDAVLARFSTALDAVQSALQMQLSLLGYNSTKSQTDQIHTRIAINYGPALIKGTDVFGDIVNVCARIESKAEPGDILISASVFDEIRHEENVAVRKRAEGVQLKGKAETLDLYEVVWQLDQVATKPAPPPSQKRIPVAGKAEASERKVPATAPSKKRLAGRRRRLVRSLQLLVSAAAVLLAGLAVFAWWFLRSGPHYRPADGSTPSIAVLPFVDLSPDKSEEYFSDGLTEQLTNDLAKTPGLRVVARTSAFQFKGKNEDLRTVAAKLNVETVLEGSVRKEGHRVRITTQLIKANDGFHIWSETYDRNVTDILAVQDEIGRAVAGALNLALLGGRGTAQPAQSDNPEAYNAYLQGRYFLERRTKEDLEKSRIYFEQAVKIDRNYAAAWASLARVMSREADHGFAPVDEFYPRARKAARKALELDPNLGEAYAALGWIQQSYDWDWSGADTSYRKALEIQPGDASTVAASGILAAALGHFDEAVALHRRAWQLDPLSPSHPHDIALVSYYTGRYGDAVDSIHRMLELNPKYPGAHMLLAMIAMAQQLPSEALSELEREPDTEWKTFGYALAYHALGKAAESDAAVRAYETKHHGEGAFQIAELHAYRGETDLAFAWLDRAYAQRDGGLVQIKHDPLLRSMEGDPRYAIFLKKMHLPA